MGNRVRRRKKDFERTGGRGRCRMRERIFHGARKKYGYEREEFSEMKEIDDEEERKYFMPNL